MSLELFAPFTLRGNSLRADGLPLKTTNLGPQVDSVNHCLISGEKTMLHVRYNELVNGGIQ